MATTSLNPNLTLIESALSKDDIMKINLYYKDGTFYNEREGTPSDIIKDIDINNFILFPQNLEIIFLHMQLSSILDENLVLMVHPILI